MLVQKKNFKRVHRSSQDPDSELLGCCRNRDLTFISCRFRPGSRPLFSFSFSFLNGILKLPKSTHRWWISDWFIVCECENPQHVAAPCLVSRDTQTLQLIGEMKVTELWDGLGGRGP